MAEEKTTFEKLKKGLLELLRGYPNYTFFGKIEYYLQDGKVLSGIDTEFTLKILKKHNIIEFASKEEVKKLNEQITQKQFEQLKAEGKKEPIWYRLAPRGIDLAIAMINLDFSGKMEKYSKETNIFTKLIGSLTGIIILLQLIQIVPPLALTLFLIIILIVLITFNKLND